MLGFTVVFGATPSAADIRHVQDLAEKLTSCNPSDPQVIAGIKLALLLLKIPVGHVPSDIKEMLASHLGYSCDPQAIQFVCDHCQGTLAAVHADLDRQAMECPG